MSFIRLYHLPAITASMYLITFLITYLIARSREDANSFFPYISDTGTYPPESCIFGQMLNILAVLMSILIYIRFRAVDDICEYYRLDDNIRKYNKISATVGYFSAFGVSLVANFQETNVLVVHCCGATLAFGFGNLWMWYQTWISYKIFPLSGTQKNNQYRLFLTVVCCINFNVTSFYFMLSMSEFKGTDMAKWKEEDGGYNHHLISSVTEWMVAISTMLYILTFSSEMKCVTFDGISLTVHKINRTHNMVTTELANIPQYKGNKVSAVDHQEFYI